MTEEMTAKQIQDRSAKMREANLKKDEESNAKLMEEMVKKRRARII